VVVWRSGRRDCHGEVWAVGACADRSSLQLTLSPRPSVCECALCEHVTSDVSDDQ
jgi:hypothetical protein